jgi:hypothetical protein
MTTIGHRFHTARTWTARGLLAMAGMTALLLTGCASLTPPEGAPRADGPRVPATGSTWVMAEKNSGSYGVPGERQMKVLGEQSWNGGKALAIASGDETSYFDDRDRYLGRSRGTAVIDTLEPAVEVRKWPLFAGKSWVSSFDYTDHQNNRSFRGVRGWFKVEAYEDVVTPAGTFKAFKITGDTGAARTVSWWSPDLGITVKQVAERSPQHYLGAGRREAELKAYDIKPAVAAGPPAEAPKR